MNIRKQVILLGLAVLYASTVVAMEKEMANKIWTYTRKDRDIEYIKALGQWLTQQRSYITEPEMWNLLLDTVASKIMFCKCNCEGNQRTALVRDIILDVAHAMQPGDNCTIQLTTRINQEVTAFDNKLILQASDDNPDFQFDNSPDFQF